MLLKKLTDTGSVDSGAFDVELAPYEINIIIIIIIITGVQGVADCELCVLWRM